MKEERAPAKKAFIYCRTSEDSEQEDGKKVSIETQEKSGLELAKRHGYKVLHVFKDRNRSGRTYPTGLSIPDKAVDAYCNECGFSLTNRTRNGLGELLQKIKDVDVIIVRNADRLMRPLPVSKLDAQILEILQEHKIIIHSHDDNIIDPNNPDHILIFKLMSTISGKGVQDRRDETKAAIRELRDTGKLYFPPYFYGFRSNGHQKVYRVEDEITIVQRIFKDFLGDKGLNDGKSLKAIARELNDENIPTLRERGKEIPGDNQKFSDRVLIKVGKGKDGKAHWLDSSIRSILTRTHYAGFQYKSNGTEMVDVAAYHPRVVSKEMFKKVQDKLEQRKGDKRGNTKRVHGLGGAFVLWSLRLQALYNGNILEVRG